MTPRILPRTSPKNDNVRASKSPVSFLLEGQHNADGDWCIFSFQFLIVPILCDSSLQFVHIRNKTAGHVPIEKTTKQHLLYRDIQPAYFL